MKATVLGLIAALAVCGPGLASAQDAPPPQLPILDVSTMLFLMLTIDSQHVDSLDPIDVNAYDIRFDVGAASTQVLDDLLQSE